MNCGQDLPSSSSSSLNLSATMAFDELHISIDNPTKNQVSGTGVGHKMKRKSDACDVCSVEGLSTVSQGKKQRHDLDDKCDMQVVARPSKTATFTFDHWKTESGSNSSSATVVTWLSQFRSFNADEKNCAMFRLVTQQCFDNPSQLRALYEGLERFFQRDFISQLPREIARKILFFLPDCHSLLSASQVCRSWRQLAEDPAVWGSRFPDWNLWMPCQKAGYKIESNGSPNETGSSPTSSISAPSIWTRCAPKASFLRRQRLLFNWRCASPRRQGTLRGHDEHVITCLQLFDQGRTMVSGSDDTTLKIWELGGLDGGRCLHTLVGHTGGVWCSQVTDDGHLIVSGSTDRTVRIWDARTGRCVRTLLGHTSTVRCMALCRDALVSGSRDTTLRVWDVRTGRCLHVLSGHSAAVRCVQFDGRRVVSGAYDFTIKVWDVPQRRCLHTLLGHTNRVYSLQFDSPRHIIVSGSLDASIRVWNAISGSCLFTLIGHQSLTSGMQLKGRILVSGNADSTLKIWDIETGRCLHTLSGPNRHTSAVTSLQCLDNGLMATSSDDGYVKLWDIKDGSFVRDFVKLPSAGSGGCIWRLKATPTSLVCAVGSRNGTEDTKLLVYDFDTDFPKN